MKKDKVKPRQLKVVQVKALVDKMATAKTIAFANYRGLTVNQISNLRSKVKETGGEVLVIKNTLLKRALTKSELPDAQSLEGPTAVVFSYEDEIAPIRAVSDSNKAFGVPVFKFGYFGRDPLDTAALEKLAKIPTRNVLNGTVVSSLASPLYGIVGVLSANTRNLVSVLDQVSKKQT